MALIDYSRSRDPALVPAVPLVPDVPAVPIVPAVLLVQAVPIVPAVPTVPIVPAVPLVFFVLFFSYQTKIELKNNYRSKKIMSSSVIPHQIKSKTNTK